MASTFNPQILVDKLSKLNSSQQSIETLSHWCIFHMNKAKQVVETWDRQFHSAPREQRLAFLYLANDILQNSRRKGAEFVAEFWKVLPDSLRCVIESGNESAKNAALRLISIWEERKVFGSRGQLLKEEFGKRQLDNSNKNRKLTVLKQQSAGGNSMDKLVSGYEAVYSCQLDEDAIFSKCRNAISFVDKVDKDVEGDRQSGHVNGGIGEELKGQHGVLRVCIDQLTAVESARANLVSLLREALQEQVNKLDQVQDQLQAAQQADNICKQILGVDGYGQVLSEQSKSGIPASQMPQKLIPGAGDQTSVTYTRQVPFAEKPSQIEDDPKSAAAAMAAKLAASSSSAQMLTFVLSSLASEGVIGNSIKESSAEHPPEKRAKLENKQPSYVPQNSQAPAPTLSLPEQMQQNLTVTSHELDDDDDEDEPPPPPSSPPPPLPPLPPMHTYPVPHYMQTAVPMLSGAYTFSPSLQPPVPPPGYVPVGPPAPGASAFGPPANGYQGYPPEGGFYGQPSSLPMAPMSRQ